MVARLTIETVPTPALVIDLGIVHDNIARMADYAASHGLKLRPHTKTHKSERMARLQLEAGAIGLTTAKAGEAKSMAHCTDDVLVAYPALDRERPKVLAELARMKTIRVAVDSALAVDVLSEAAQQSGSTIGILVDLDVGHHRTGVQTPSDASRLAKHIDHQKGVRLDGILFYPGHLTIPSRDQVEPMRQIDKLIKATIDEWRKLGLEASIVSGGSTPTAKQSHQATSVNEIRPGTYIFNDMNTVSGGWCRFEDCAARILCTVVSNAVPNKVVLDCGTKSLTSDRSSKDHDRNGHGRVVEYTDARIVRLTEEHAEVDVSRCLHVPRLGERVSVVPNHVCPCINLHDAVWIRHSDDSLEPLPVDARGLTV